MRSASAFDADVKVLIAKRDGFRCDRCGLKVIDGQCHHRRPRRAGGSGDFSLGMASNGLWLHSSCHDVVESKRRISAELGFIVGYGAHPSDVPVYRWNGWHWLRDDGTLVPLPGPPAFPIALKD